MKENETSKEHRTPSQPAESSTTEKRAWREPKLEFVEPKLTKQGDVVELTGQGFFGTFVPQ